MTLIYSTYEAKRGFRRSSGTCAKAGPSRFLIEESPWLRSAESSVTRQQTIEERLDDLQRRGVLVRSGAPEQTFSQWRVGRGPWRGSWLSVANERGIRRYVGVSRYRVR